MLLIIQEKYKGYLKIQKPLFKKVRQRSVLNNHPSLRSHFDNTFQFRVKVLLVKALVDPTVIPLISILLLYIILTNEE